MLYLYDCGIGNTIELYTNESGTELGPVTNTTAFVVAAVYLGFYPENRDSGDKCLVGWSKKQALNGLKNTMPKALIDKPQVSNPYDYNYFRWCGQGRYVNRDLGSQNARGTLPSFAPKPGELSPVHAPGWHQCKCGFRNQDISISAIIGGKYVCYQCRNIWKNNA